MKITEKIKNICWTGFLIEGSFLTRLLCSQLPWGDRKWVREDFLGKFHCVVGSLFGNKSFLSRQSQNETWKANRSRWARGPLSKQKNWMHRECKRNLIHDGRKIIFLFLAVRQITWPKSRMGFLSSARRKCASKSRRRTTVRMRRRSSLMSTTKSLGQSRINHQHLQPHQKLTRKWALRGGLTHQEISHCWPSYWQLFLDFIGMLTAFELMFRKWENELPNWSWRINC